MNKNYLITHYSINVILKLILMHRIYELEWTLPQKDTYIEFYCFLIIEVKNTGKSLDQDPKVEDIMYELQGNCSRFSIEIENRM